MSLLMREVVGSTKCSSIWLKLTCSERIPMLCPCGSQKEFTLCCQPLIEKKALPETAEALMRSRYTAFTRGEMDYILYTLAPEAREGFDPDATRVSAQKAKWKELRVLNHSGGEAGDTEGTVEFIAEYGHGENNIEHHEISTFRKNERGQWLYVDGEMQRESTRPVVRGAPKIGRNDPCSCGSAKKFKKCCGV